MAQGSIIQRFETAKKRLKSKTLEAQNVRLNHSLAHRNIENNHVEKFV